jgi:AcrR family transcriptional regulator
MEALTHDRRGGGARPAAGALVRAGASLVGSPPMEPTRAAADINNRSRLLLAATDAFAEFGYEGASLRAIADNAGVSFQLITYYFGTKEELWIATVDYLFERYLETGKGLGFTPSGNLYEQFRNHLRLFLTDMLQRPQLRKIWIQEYLANSERYKNVIRPRIKDLHDNQALPYYEEVVRLGIVKKFTASELSLIWSSIIQNNVVYPYYIELTLGIPATSAKFVETQVDLLFSVLTEEPDAERDAAREAVVADVVAAPPVDAAPAAAAHEGAGSAPVYAWEDAKELSPERNRIKQLELENTNLRQLVGGLSLDKKLLLDRIGLLERGTKS